METDRDKRNRKRSQLNFSDLINSISSPILGKLTILPLLPVLFSCISPYCHPHADETEDLIDMEVAITKSSIAEITTLDLFTFENDPLARFDAYMRTEDITEDRIRMMSGQGNKIIFACANSQRDRYDWADISSIASLESIHADLEKERRTHLLMTARETATTGSGKACKLSLRPLVCEVVLRSLRCDFSNKSYEGAVLENVSVYLTNVNARCCLTAEDAVMPTRIINHGGLSSEDLDSFLDPELVYRRLDEKIGETCIECGISLLCYPNAASDESPGSPFTRLVIEGSLEGVTYWWPININRMENMTGSEPGLHRNRSYVYDIVIRRKGSTDPDIPVGIEDIDIIMKILPWTEKDGYSVGF